MASLVRLRPGQRGLGVPEMKAQKLGDMFVNEAQEAARAFQVVVPRW